MNRRGFLGALFAVPVAASLPYKTIARILSPQARETALINLLRARIAAANAMFAEHFNEMLFSDGSGDSSIGLARIIADGEYQWREVSAGFTIPES